MTKKAQTTTTSKALAQLGLATPSIQIQPPTIVVQAPPPAVLHQYNQEPRTGLTKGLFLEHVARFEAAGGTVSKLGKLRIVPEPEFVAFMLSHTARPKGADAEVDEDDELAAACGLRAAGARR